MGPMVIMVYRMLAQDIVRFMSIFFIFVMGFSQGYYVLFQVRTLLFVSHDPPEL